MSVELQSVIQCPECGNRYPETMPLDHCRYYWECPGCGALIKPKPGHCCVYCSFGTVPCPPVQAQGRQSCCADGDV